MNNKTLFSLSLCAVLLTGAGCSVSEPVETGTNVDLEDSLGITKPLDINMEIKSNVALSDFTTAPTSFPGILADADRQNRTAKIKTTKGDITVELFGDEAPMTVSNFLVLAHTGYYDDLIFHRVIKGFMIQGGDPTGTGAGGPGYKFADELGGEHKTYPPGTLAMANSGPNTNGSQFFIMHGSVQLSNDYTIFGQVVEGQAVVDAIANVETSAGDRPVGEVAIEGVEIK